MARQVHVSSVFSYSYRLADPQDPAMAGFSINLYSSDVLLYTCYDIENNRVLDFHFNLRPNTAATCEQQMRQAAWLEHMPPKMAVQDGNTSQSRIVFGNGITSTYYCIDDFETLLVCPFGSTRGHYSRAVYNLLEDLTGLLRPQGLSFMPDGFTWREEIIRPAQVQTYPTRWAMPQNQTHMA